MSEFNPLLEDEGPDEEEAELRLPTAEELVLPTPLPPVPRGRRTHGLSLPSHLPEVDDVLLDLEDTEPAPYEADEELSMLAHELGLVDEGPDDDDLSEDTSAPEYQEAWSMDDLGMGEDEDEEEDLMGGINLDAILAKAIDVGASDVDVIANDSVSFEIRGDMHRVEEFGILVPEITTRLQLQIISHVLEQDFVENLELDTAYVLRSGPHKGRRMRLSVGKSFGDIFLVFRVISDQIPSPEALGVPDVMQKWCELPNGLVLICGPTGSGKSTTFASMIRKIQLERPQKIITIEKPIEYVFGRDGKAVIVQREVGRDARTFANALKSAMRQHPKIIMVGEVRDQEEVDEVLRAAETGHLALTTLHATSPPVAITRIMSLYTGQDRLRILSSLKDNVRGIANQTLVKSKDGKSRFALHAILDVTPEVSAMIGEGDGDGLQEYMRERGLTMEHKLAEAVKQGRCHMEDARIHASFPDLFDELLAED